MFDKKANSVYHALTGFGYGVLFIRPKTEGIRPQAEVKPLRGIQHRPLGLRLVIRAVCLAGLPGHKWETFFMFILKHVYSLYFLPLYGPYTRSKRRTGSAAQAKDE